MHQRLENRRGYFGIGVFNYKHDVNIAGLYRTAWNMDCSFLYTIGRKYHYTAADTPNSTATIPYYHYISFEEFLQNRPNDCILIGVEQHKKAKFLPDFYHPLKACYLLGNETAGLPEKVLEKMDRLVQIESRKCLNLHVAGSIVLYDRVAKLHRSSFVLQGEVA